MSTEFEGKLIHTPRDHFDYTIQGTVTYKAKGKQLKRDLTRCGETEREAMSSFLVGVLAEAEALEKEVYAL